MQHLNPHAEREAAGEMTLYDRHAPALYRYIYRQVSHPQDAEDVLLEVFMAAFKYESLADLTPQQQIAWLQSVARRRIIDRYRRDSRAVLLPLEHALEMLDDALTPEEHTLQQETYARLYTALAQLPPLQREIVRLRFGEGLRFAEIAATLQKSERTVRKMLSRVLHQLRNTYTHQ